MASMGGLVWSGYTARPQPSQEIRSYLINGDPHEGLEDHEAREEFRRESTFVSFAVFAIIVN